MQFWLPMAPMRAIAGQQCRNVRPIAHIRRRVQTFYDVPAWIPLGFRL
jgi:hypothetical protein